MPPSSNNPDDYTGVIKDSVVASALGMAGMVARILIDPTPLSFGWIIRRTIMSGIVAVFVGFSIQDQIQSWGPKFAAIGLSGAAAPEILDAAIRRVKRKAESDINANGKKRKRK